MNAEQHQAAADPQIKPSDLAAIAYIHLSILLLLSPKADTHLTVPRRGEG